MNAIKQIDSQKTKRAFNLDGLCTTCIHSENCIFCDSQEVVHLCEEFDSSVEEKKINKISVPEKSQKEEEYVGLCSNCANVSGCMFSKPKSGVWHCEEYR